MTKLQYYRKEKRLTQEELSNLSNISIRSIQQYEQGLASIDSCSIRTLLEFSRILGVRFCDLYEDDSLRKRVVEQFTADGSERAER